MKIDTERLSERQTWNNYAQRRIELIHASPTRFIIRDSPSAQLGVGEAHLRVHTHLVRALGSLTGKSVGELGCGLGDFSVFIEKCGAHVTGIDIGPDLVEAAGMLARVNEVTCRFQHASMTALPFDSGSLDAVVGTDVLHHLSPPDVLVALGEADRVLSARGVAVFSEPIENSRIFDLLQNLVPIAKGTVEYRPSILQRKAWAEYTERAEDRALTTRELVRAGRMFRAIDVHAYGLLIRAEWLIPRKFGFRRRITRLLGAIDGSLLALGPLRHLSQRVVVTYQK